MVVFPLSYKFSGGKRFPSGMMLLWAHPPAKCGSDVRRRIWGVETLNSFADDLMRGSGFGGNEDDQLRVPNLRVKGDEKLVRL